MAATLPDDASFVYRQIDVNGPGFVPAHVASRGPNRAGSAPASMRVIGYASRASTARGDDTARIRQQTSSVSRLRNASKSSSPDSAWLASVP